MIAELSCERDFEKTDITTIPKELVAALKDVLVPLLSPPNCLWGDSMQSDINFGNLTWCKNQEMRDASAPLRKTKAGGGMQQEAEKVDGKSDVGQFPCVGLEGILHGYTSIDTEVKDRTKFGGEDVVAVTKKVDTHSVSLLIGRDLCDWNEKTVFKFAKDVSVYRMDERGVIVRVSPLVKRWETGRKVLIALNLNLLHPGRTAALPHAT